MNQKLARIFVVVGIILHGVLAVGTVLTIASLIRTFGAIASESDSAGAAARLSEGISLALNSVMLTRPIGLAGLVLIAVGIVAGRLRDHWILTWGCICMVPWLLNIGIGTLIGAIGLGTFLVKRKAFTKEGDPKQHPLEPTTASDRSSS